MDLPIRHTLAALAYRLGKILRGMQAGFRDFSGGGNARTPGQILAHIGDLMDWALAQVEGRKEWHNSEPLPWEQEIERFYSAIERLDQRIAAHGVSPAATEKLFQGAIADAFTHAGQIALLRRLAGNPVRGENYAAAEITAGRVGRDQAAPRIEFD